MADERWAREITGAALAHRGQRSRRPRSPRGAQCSMTGQAARRIAPCPDTPPWARFYLRAAMTHELYFNEYCVRNLPYLRDPNLAPLHRELARPGVADHHPGAEEAPSELPTFGPLRPGTGPSTAAIRWGARDWMAAWLTAGPNVKQGGGSSVPCR